MTNLLIGDDNTIQFPRTSSSASPYDSFVAALNPLVNLRFNEASGAIINYGSLGGSAAVTGSPTYGASAGSPTGGGIRVDAAPEYFTVTNNAALNLTAFSKIFTVKAYTAGISTTLGRIFQHNDEVIYFGGNVQLNYEVFIGGAKVSVLQSAFALGGSYPTDPFTVVVTVDGANVAMYAFNDTINVSNTASGTGTADSHGANNMFIANRADGIRNADADFYGAVVTADVLDASDIAALRLLMYGV